MNIRGTKNKLGVTKNTIRELNESEWELVGGGTSLEIAYSQQCATRTCPPPPTQGCSVGCTPSYTCNCGGGATK